jgi:ABC-type dipeptide/oligopeptide/nickel transport system permease subunit
LLQNHRKFIPRCARVVRSSALAVRETPYIDAARACGFSPARIIMRHMVPNVFAPYLIEQLPETAANLASGWA